MDGLGHTMNGQKDVNTLLAMTTSSRCCPVCASVLWSLGPRVSQFLTSSVLQYPTHHPLLLPLFHIALLGSLLLFMKWQERVALLIIECYFYFSPLRVTISISERISFHVSRSFLFLVFLALDKEFSLLKNFAASAPWKVWWDAPGKWKCERSFSPSPAGNLNNRV